MENSETIPKIIFIVPYRDREPQLNHYKHYMKYILEDIPKDDYKIYFIYQNDSKPFNRGAIKNIGFIAIKNKYPLDYKDITLIFNDIDTMPAFKNQLNYSTKSGTIKHFYGYKNTLGGIISITGNDFEFINGFLNFWGWGLEDNSLYDRVLYYNINIDRSNFYNYDDIRIINLKDNNNKIYSKQQIWRASINNKTGINTIKNLTYRFREDMIIVNNFETEVNPSNDNYYKDIAKSISNADYKFKPTDAVNNDNYLIHGGVPIINNNNNNNNNNQNNNNIFNKNIFNKNNKAINVRGLNLKLF